MKMTININNFTKYFNNFTLCKRISRYVTLLPTCMDKESVYFASFFFNSNIKYSKIT